MKIRNIAEERAVRMAAFDKLLDDILNVAEEP